MPEEGGPREARGGRSVRRGRGRELGQGLRGARARGTPREGPPPRPPGPGLGRQLEKCNWRGTQIE